MVCMFNSKNNCGWINCFVLCYHKLMRKTVLMLLCLLFLCVPVFYIFPEGSVFEINEPEPRGNFAIRGLIATGETLFSNLFVMGFNTFVTREDWGYPTREAIHKNFTERWKWDDSDGFIVNFYGHPAQGSQYFVAGRVNQFNFYQSLFFSALGSFTWENFFENHGAAMNDVIVTSLTSMMFGEMLYRLYVEAHAAGFPAPISFFFNPMAGLHRLITGWQPPDYGRNMYQLKTYIGMGYPDIHYSALGIDDELFSFRGPFAHLGFSLIYGNPFLAEGKIPFRHFELEMSLGMDLGNFVEARLISDGYLFSFSPVHTTASMMSTGLSLNWDAIALGKLQKTDATINVYSNALNWTMKSKNLLSQNLSFETKAHAGITFMGAGIYYSPDRERDLAFYGFGLNTKLFLTLEHARLGKLEADVFGYGLLNYPGTSQVSGGGIYWLLTDLGYSYQITRNLSLGISHAFALERGFFDNQPDTRKHSNTFKFVVAWNW